MKTDDLIRVLAQDLETPAVSVGTSMRWALPLAVAIMSVGWLALVGVRVDLMSTGLRPALMKVTLGVLLATLGLAAAARLSRPEHSSADAFRPFIVVPVLAALAVVGELVALGSDDWSKRLMGHSIPVCLAVIPALSALPMAGAFYALRRGATSYPVTVGAAAGIGSAGLAIVAYGLFCDEDSALFISTWYVLASTISGLVGAALGRVALRW